MTAPRDVVPVMLTREQAEWVAWKAMHAGDGTDLVSVGVYDAAHEALARPAEDVFETTMDEKGLTGWPPDWKGTHHVWVMRGRR